MAGPKLRDIIEKKGDKVLYQQDWRCEHPIEWCIHRISILDRGYWHCYKCNTDIPHEYLNTSPWNRAEKMNGTISPDCWEDTWDDPQDDRLESFDELYTWEGE